MACNPFQDIAAESSGREYGWSSAVAVDSNGYPHIGFLDYSSTFAEGRFGFAKWNGSIWEVETSIDVKSGRYVSIKIDSNDVIHAAYYSESYYRDLKYIKNTGSGWGAPEILDSSGQVGKYSSLALDSNDNPHIVYWDETNTSLKYIKYNGSSWDSPITLDNSGYVGEYCSIAIDSLDNIHVSYLERGPDNLKYIKYNGSSWDTPVTLDASSRSGFYSKIAVDASNNPHICYYEASNKDLKYVKYNGSSWDTPVIVDSTGDVGAYNSIDIDSNGNPCISYVNITNGFLKYAKYDGSWALSILDNSGDIDRFTSLVLLSDCPCISYCDEHGNYDLLYYGEHETPVSPLEPVPDNQCTTAEVANLALFGFNNPITTGLLATFGYLCFEGISSNVITDYCNRALDRLTEQFETKTRIATLICAFTAEVQEIELVIYDLLIKRSLDASTGAQLDGVGEIVGKEREPGQSDEDYRTAIRIQIGINNGSGEPETLITAFKELTNANIILYQENYPAGVSMYSDGGIVPNLKTEMEKIAPAGVNLNLVVSGSDPSETFAFSPEGGIPDPDGLGFEDPPDLGGIISERVS